MVYLVLGIYYLFSLYMFILALRVVLDWISVLSVNWRPKGLILVGANFVYALTDPPIRFFGRLIPPLRLGGIALDLGFLVFFLLLILAQRAWVMLAQSFLL